MNTEKNIEENIIRGTVLVTGASNGIGLATCKRFLIRNFNVIGIDKLKSPIKHKNYTHYKVDVRDKDNLPEITEPIHYVVNNAGVVKEEDAIDVNLIGYLNIIDKYCMENKDLKSLINIASISAHAGIEGVRHSASQGGRISITRNLAIQLGKKYGTRVNSISPGAVLTNLEPKLYQNKKLIKAVANENILKKWIRPIEVANWIYFISIVDKSLTGQDILLDCGEFYNFNFIDGGDN